MAVGPGLPGSARRRGRLHDTCAWLGRHAQHSIHFARKVPLLQADINSPACSATGCCFSLHGSSVSPAGLFLKGRDHISMLIQVNNQPALHRPFSFAGHWLPQPMQSCQVKVTACRWGGTLRWLKLARMSLVMWDSS